MADTFGEALGPDMARLHAQVVAGLRRVSKIPVTQLVEMIRASDLPEPVRSDVAHIVSMCPGNAALMVKLCERLDAMERAYPLPDGVSTQ
jgi:hypothetical protein